MKSLLRSLELVLRHLVTYPLLRLLFQNPPRQLPLDLTSVQRLLILRYDRLGDIVVTTPVFRRLKELRPDLYLGVLASRSNAELLNGNPFVDQVHTLPKHWWNFPTWISQARSVHYDVVLNFIFNRTTSGGVLANLIAPNAIKVGQGADKYAFYFNLLLKLDRGEQHMTEVLMQLVDRVFGLTPLARNPGFELFISPQKEEIVEKFISQSFGVPDSEKGYVVLNISAAEQVRMFSQEQSTALARILVNDCRQNVVVISAPGDAGNRKTVVQSAGGNCREFPPHGNTDLMTIAGLIRSAKCVVTPDTSIVHIASAVKTPVIAFYTPLQVTNEWMPFGIKNSVVLADGGKPVSTIPLETLREQTTRFLAGV